MRQLARSLVVVLILSTVAACGQVDPVLLVVSMPGCVYQGPPTMVASNVRLSLRVNGLADVGADLVELTGDKTGSDLAGHLATAGGGWDQPPDWASPVTAIRVDSGRGEKSAQDTIRLESGRYAVVCVDYPRDSDPVARLASALQVTDP